MTGGKIGGPFRDDAGGSGSWRIIDRPASRFGPEGDDIAVPDLAGWRETMPEYPDAACLAIAPDRVCEALASSARRTGRHKKAVIRARGTVSGTRFANCGAKTLEAFGLKEVRHRALPSAPADDAPASSRLMHFGRKTPPVTAARRERTPAMTTGHGTARLI